ncbi:MAG TPA: hypothetical protein VGY31_08400 [Terriglobia bacterium]|nr:hypothetical protein [Terriglobia bacterium]
MTASRLLLQRLPKPKPWGPEKGKAMSIGIGFRFDCGWLLCADTKITAAVKTNETKTFVCGYSDPAFDCVTAFTVAASDFGLAKSAIRDCEEAVRKTNFLTASIRSVRHAIESELVRFYKSHVYPIPNFADPFEFLLTIWLHGESQLYISSGTTFQPVDKYECIGSGSYLAKYLIKGCHLRYHEDQGSLRVERKPTLDEVSLVGGYVLNQLAEHDEYVGGEPEMTVIKDTGEVDSASSPSYPSDTLPSKAQKLLWEMLEKLILVENRNKDECVWIVDEFCHAIVSLNEEDRKLFDFIQSQLRKDKGA